MCAAECVSKRGLPYASLLTMTSTSSFAYVAEPAMVPGTNERSIDRNEVVLLHSGGEE